MSCRAIASLVDGSSLSLLPPHDQRSRLVPETPHEIGKAVIGQDVVIERLLVALLANGHVLLEGMPGLAKTLLVKSLGTALGVQFERIQFTPDLLPSDVVGTMIFSAEGRRLRHARGPDLRQPRAGRRNQPRPGQGPVRPARGHAGTAGHDRRQLPSAAAAVLRHGDAESGRAGGHLPAARGADRSLSLQAARRLSVRRGGGADDGAWGQVTKQPALAAGLERRGTARAPRRRSTPSMSRPPCRPTSSRSCAARATSPLRPRAAGDASACSTSAPRRAPRSRSFKPAAPSPGCAAATTSRPPSSRKSSTTSCATASA